MPTDNPNGPITVLGAGIVGTSCALALQRDGFQVSLVDRDTPGAGASSGNAGMIQTGTPRPLAMPGLLKAVPGMLFDPDGALVIRWKYLPRLLPWLLRFAREASAARSEANSKAIMALLDQAGEAYRELLSAAGADDMVRYKGMLYVYRGADAARAAKAEMDLFRRRGVTVETLDADEIRQMEPDLDRAYTHGYYLPACFYTVDPKALTERFAAAFERTGGKFVRADVQDIEVGAQGPTALVTADGRIPVERLVLAAGAFSKKFARRLGIDVPLESARGYHLMLPREALRLNGPVIDGEKHFAAIPMAGGIRLAGMVELASLGAAPNYARAQTLLPLAQAMLPDLSGKDAAAWMGHRPAMPDSLPVIERSRAHSNTIFAFGHGQLGLTMGAITGLVVSDLAAGRPPRVDLAPYRSNRY